MYGNTKGCNLILGLEGLIQAGSYYYISFPLFDGKITIINVLFQHLSVMEDMLKDFMLGEHLLLVGNQVCIFSSVFLFCFVLCVSACDNES